MDFGDIFSLVVGHTSINFILCLVVAFDLEIEKMDLETTFLHGDLEEEIYTKECKWFTIKGKKVLVSKLKKSLSGLKQTPRRCYQKFDTYI